MATNIPLTGEFRVTCEFKRKGNWQAGWHTGIDLVNTNHEIYSSCNGVVFRVSYSKSYGNFIVIKSDDGFFHWFCHLSQILTIQGRRVTRTTKIAKMGNTGNSTGTHLHFEIRNASNRYSDVINPADYMKIPNAIGTYNTENYKITENTTQTQKQTVTKIFAVKTNIREKPCLAGTPHLYRAGTTVEILQENVGNSNGYIWDKVYCKATNRTGYVARTGGRYK